MQKGKFLSPDGFSVKIFVAFFIIKEDLLRVVNESQRSGKVLGDFNSTFIALIPKKQEGKNISDY
jgi:hypothetical protein